MVYGAPHGCQGQVALRARRQRGMAGNPALCGVGCMLQAVPSAGQVQHKAERVAGMVLQANGRVHCQHLHGHQSTNFVVLHPE